MGVGGLEGEGREEQRGQGSQAERIWIKGMSKEHLKIDT